MHNISIRFSRLAASILLAVLASSALAAPFYSKITITRRGSQPSEVLPGQHYTGLVRLEQKFISTEPARLAGEQLSFEPGARSAWHENPMGQAILVTSGKMVLQEENGPLEEAFPGDVVTFPPKIKHWFGAAPDTAMSALIMAEIVNGHQANWLEKVADEQYKATSTNKTSKHLVINRAGSLPSGKANPKNFTGDARTDALFSAKDGSNAYGAIVTFEPCARTDWHSHPMGQTLIITSGRGYVQEPGGPRHELRQGDIAWTPSDVVHWHGAAPDTAMAHIALSERVEGRAVAWGTKVTDDEYGMANVHQLPLKQQKIALIAAFTANGDMDRLKQVLVEGLEAGLTVNEIKEVLIHTYAYAGFPRALNAINAFIAVMDDREKAGIKDVYGPESSTSAMNKDKYQYGHDVLAKLRDPKYVPGTAVTASKPRYETFTPAIEVFLKEHLFADLFSRDVLDYQNREIATVGVLSNLPGADAQFRSHTALAMTQGASEEQMRHLFTMMGSYLGKERSDNALAVLKEITASRKK